MCCLFYVLFPLFGVSQVLISVFWVLIYVCVYGCVSFQVLIPVFALGRAQELCILLETYWERMNLKVPIYFTLGLTEKVIMLSRNNNNNNITLFAMNA